MFRALNGLRNGLAPRSILVDYEKSAIKAFMEGYPHVEPRGCYFYFQQSLEKNSDA